MIVGEYWMASLAQKGDVPSELRRFFASITCLAGIGQFAAFSAPRIIIYRTQPARNTYQIPTSFEYPHIL